MADELPMTAADFPDDEELQFVDWMQRYLDANLQPDEARQLNERLRASPRWRAKFVRCLTQSMYLEEQLAQDRAETGLIGSAAIETTDSIEPMPGPGPAGVVPFDGSRLSSANARLKDSPPSLLMFAGRHRRAAYILGGLAAAVLLVAVLWSRFGGDNFDANRGRQLDSVARVFDARNCRWLIDGKSQAVEQLPTGREIQLVEGIAEVEFALGARAVIESPARLKVVDANHIVFSEGTIVCHIPESAIGFTVETPSSKLVDLGTEFGIRATAAGETENYVFKGKVRVEPARAQSLELSTGEAAVVNPDGTIAPNKRPRFSSEQLFRLHKRLPGLAKRILEEARKGKSLPIQSGDNSPEIVPAEPAAKNKFETEM